MSFQQIQLVGHLGSSPDLRYTPSGVPVASFRLAINRHGSEGAEKQPLWLKVVCWRKHAELVSQYLEKGRQVMIVGELEDPELWTGKDGKQNVTQVVTARQVVFLSGNRGDTSNGHATSAEPAGADVGDGENIPF